MSLFFLKRKKKSDNQKSKTLTTPVFVGLPEKHHCHSFFGKRVTNYENSMISSIFVDFRNQTATMYVPILTQL